MHLRSLELEEFRSYRRLALDLEPAGLRLAGPNASGKSTLLEAIALLATTRSPRSGADRELPNWASGADYGVPPFARVRGAVVSHGDDFTLEIAVQADAAGGDGGARGTATDGSAGRQARKQIRVNGRPVRAMDAVGRLKAVLFSPEDVSLVAGPPTGRRRYLDVLISQLDGRYLRALARYGKLLAQRNGLLRSLARDRVDAGAPAVAEQLAYWDEELVAAGAAITARRARTVIQLAERAAARFELLDGSDALAVTYRPSVPVSTAAARWAEGGQGGGESGDPEGGVTAIVARDFSEALRTVRREEVRRGSSLLGPHRDDLGLALGGVDLATFGSRGQQRLAVLAMKLAEVDLMAEDAGEAPVVLLDDVLSELDVEHAALLLDTVGALGSQTIVTATDPSLLDVPSLRGLPLARLNSGQVVPDPA
ncbi:MAG: DNA recombination and repair protein RecF [uncultured Thermomicrobiales bacterium]|uniref:DNA replication and repair protein RecF n=1 Tax=uncultured Thermomicrobiales bacterium TaxID=1645740 RepID=A0A6J4VEZ7_9BACT|nr:MAG: DNA recombination and repair protein RecF [uncultured Thermomicrobiales bacterium]